MKSRYWVTLSLRLIGLVLVGITLYPLGTRVGDIVRTSYVVSSYSLNDAIVQFVQGSGSVALFALGVYLFLGGNWVVNRLFRGLEPSRCPKCNYDMSGLSEGAVCPECGSGKGEG